MCADHLLGGRQADGETQSTPFRVYVRTSGLKAPFRHPAGISNGQTPRGFIWKGERKPQRCVMAGCIAQSLSPRSLAHPKPENAGSAAPGGKWPALPDTRGRPRTTGGP